MDLICPLLQCTAIVRMKLRHPITLYRKLSVLPYKIPARKQLFQTAEKCIFARHISKA